jgi:hypothetical protein
LPKFYFAQIVTVHEIFFVIVLFYFRTVVWFGHERVTAEQIRFVTIEVTTDGKRYAVFSNGDRVYADLLLPYNIVALIIVGTTFYFLFYIELYILKHILKYDIIKLAYLK